MWEKSGLLFKQSKNDLGGTLGHILEILPLQNLCLDELCMLNQSNLMFPDWKSRKWSLKWAPDFHRSKHSKYVRLWNPESLSVTLNGEFCKSFCSLPALSHFLFLQRSHVICHASLPLEILVSITKPLYIFSAWMTPCHPSVFPDTTGFWKTFWPLLSPPITLSNLLLITSQQSPLPWEVILTSLSLLLDYEQSECKVWICYDYSRHARNVDKWTSEWKQEDTVQNF